VLRAGETAVLGWFWGSRTSTSLRQPTAVPRFEDVDITAATDEDDVILQPELNSFLGFKDLNITPTTDKDGTFR
jgi:hypothetical protein